jgi:hypothetical protein
MATVRGGRARLLPVNTSATCGTTIAEQKNHDGQRNQADDARVERGAHQLAAQGQGVLQVLRQAFEHLAQGAALLAGGNHGAVGGVKFARETGPGLCQSWRPR